jgi:hypothetical protein
MTRTSSDRADFRPLSGHASFLPNRSNVISLKSKFGGVKSCASKDFPLPTLMMQTKIYMCLYWMRDFGAKLAARVPPPKNRKNNFGGSVGWMSSRAIGNVLRRLQLGLRETEPFQHAIARRTVGQNLFNPGYHIRRRKVVLHQLRNDSLPGNQIDHGKV